MYSEMLTSVSNSAKMTISIERGLYKTMMNNREYGLAQKNVALP